MATRATIDWDKCTGNGVCARVAPEIFTVDADGNSDVIVDEVPEELKLKAQLAMRQCPTQAISLTED